MKFKGIPLLVNKGFEDLILISKMIINRRSSNFKELIKNIYLHFPVVFDLWVYFNIWGLLG